ncbi:hypothetical protein ACMFMF_010621 [Clarireedia jacksonii]
MVTCFIPGLPAGEPFRISIHSWQNPEASRYIHQISSKHAEHVVFEARVYVDGRLAGTKLFHRTGPWPTVLETSIGNAHMSYRSQAWANNRGADVCMADLDKQGDYKKLEFPAFHRELLSQSYWNPGDDLGRVKVLISEGFPRENISMPFERVKNLVAFSFQHAPLDVLETSSIAWPNAAMWRQVSLVAPFYGHHTSPRHTAEDLEAHSHSPRKSSTVGFLGTKAASMPPPPPPFAKPPTFDPFTTEPVGPAFSQWRRQASSTDESMPDLSLRGSTQVGSFRNVSDPMIVERTGRQNIVSEGGFEALCEALIPSAPSNTPQNGAELVANKTIANMTAAREPPINREIIRSLADRVPTPGPAASPQEFAALIHENATTESNTSHSRRVSSESTSGIPSKPEKENDGPSPVSQESESAGKQQMPNMRRSSHPFTATNITGTKRQRNVTPASSKVIDDEDEPRSSPSLRKVSRQSKQEGKEGDRRILSGIENV